MANEFLVKNPGCTYCRFYIEPFEHKGEKTRGVCKKSARKVFENSKVTIKKRRWLWVDCVEIEEKNGDRFCQDFQIQSITYKIFGQVLLIFKSAGSQLPPALSDEKWWKT